MLDIPSSGQSVNVPESPSHGLLTPSSSPTIRLEESFFFFPCASFTNNKSISHDLQSPYRALILWTTIHLIWSLQGQIPDNLRQCLCSRACWNHLSLPITHSNPDYLPVVPCRNHHTGSRPLSPHLFLIYLPTFDLWFLMVWYTSSF